MIKILQIGMCSNYGGVEAFVMNYYRKINRKNISFDFIDMYGNGLACADEIKEMGGNVYILKNYKKHPLKTAFQLREILLKGNYDIIHDNMPSAANMIPVFVSCTSKSKPVVIAHSHNTNIPSGPIKFVLHNINVHFLRKMPVEKWACGITAGKWMWGKTFETENVIPNAIDTELFHYDLLQRKRIRDQYHYNKTDVVIGYVGRLCEAKNVLFLLRILFELRKISSTYKLLIVGSGNLDEQMKCETKKLGLESEVVFIGKSENVSAYYSAMDAFALPSLFEGVPLVGIEAQACNLPCFVSENISSELDITGNVRFLPINRGAYIWANTIDSEMHQVNRSEKSLPQKYDLKFAAEELQKRYVDLLRNAGCEKEKT